MAGVAITEHLRPGQLEHELGKIEDPRDPPMPVIVRRGGVDHEAVLHGWSRNPRGVAGMWALVTGVRPYAPGFEAEFCWWVTAEDVRPR